MDSPMEKAEREHHQWISHGLTMEKASRFTIINIHQHSSTFINYFWQFWWIYLNHP